MRHWPVQDAKARFSEMLDACATEGAQIVTKRGAEAAVLAPVEERRRLNARPTLNDLLLQDEGRGGLNIPARGKVHRRSIFQL